MTRFFKQGFLLLAFAFIMTMSADAFGCPNCKLANETDSALPRAYMYSILFMIGMPATIFTGFGISFYRMTKKAQMEAVEGMLPESDNLDNSETPDQA